MQIRLAGWQEDRNISVKAPLLSDCSHLWMEAVGVLHQRDISVCWADLSAARCAHFYLRLHRHLGANKHNCIT